MDEQVVLGVFARAWASLGHRGLLWLLGVTAGHCTLQRRSEKIYAYSEKKWIFVRKDNLICTFFHFFYHYFFKAFFWLSLSEGNADISVTTYYKCSCSIRLGKGEQRSIRPRQQRTIVFQYQQKNYEMF